MSSLDTELDMEMIVADMRQEFIEDSGDRLDGLEQIIAELLSDKGQTAHGVLEIKRHIHNLKGLGSCFGFPAVSLWSHALEDYLELAPDVGVNQLWDIQLFIDSIRGILDAGVNPSDDEVAAAVKGMQLKGLDRGRSRSTAAQCVLLLMPRGIQRKIISRELSALGFKVIIVENSMQAIDLAITLKPEIVISSFILDRLSGIELARILNAMNSTKHHKFLLMTSSDAEDILGDIPENVRIAEKGRAFARELIAFLNEFNFLN